EKQIAGLCRKAVIAIQEGAPTLAVTTDNLEKYAGKPKVRPEKVENTNEVGLVNGLYYSTLGGGILKIEATPFASDKPKLEITGNLQKVMGESVKVANTAVRKLSEQFNEEAKREFDKNQEVHVHVLDGAGPK